MVPSATSAPTGRPIDLHQLYDGLPPEIREAVDERAQDYALIEITERDLDTLERTGELPRFQRERGLAVGWRHVVQALQEALEIQQGPTEPPAGQPAPIKPHEVPLPPTDSYPRAVAYAKFLRQAGAIGDPIERFTPWPASEQVMITRGTLACGVDFGIVVNKEKLETPTGEANQFAIFLQTLNDPAPIYYGPFDDAILPNE